MIEVTGINDSNGNSLWVKPEPMLENPFKITNTFSGVNTCIVTKNGNAPDIDLEYSFDKSEWVKWVPDINGVRSVEIPQGGVLYLHGDNSSGLCENNNDTDYYNIDCSESYTVSDDIISLISPYQVEVTLPTSAFRRLFYGSTTLTDSSSLLLTAITIPAGFYRGMFRGCSNMTSAPEIMATSFYANSSDKGNGSLSEMFYGCSKLDYLKVNFMNWNSGNGTQNWLNGVFPYGTLDASLQLSKSIGMYDNSGCPDGWVIPKQYLTFKNTSSSSANLYAVYYSGSSSNVTISYSTNNGSTWTSKSLSGTSSSSFGTVNAGSTVLIKGSTDTLKWGLGLTQNFVVYGNIRSLISGDDFATSSTQPGYRAFRQMFRYFSSSLQKCSSLYLPSGSANSDVCYGMFEGNTVITKAPQINFTSLNSTSGAGSLDTMFYNCSKLNMIKVKFTNWYSGKATANWVYGVSGSGTFYKPSGLGTNRGVNYIPNNWTVTNA